LKDKIGKDLIISDGATYRLSEKPRVTGNLEYIEFFPEWNTGYLINKLPSIHRDDSAKEDLRISVNAFTVSLPSLKLENLLKRGLRIKVSITNPNADAVLRLRFLLREDESAEDCRSLISGQQGRYLNRLRSMYPSLFEFRFSEALCFGPFFHSNDWAIFGIHLAHQSSEKGPMIELEAGSTPWDVLNEDFRHIWEQKTTLPPPPVRGVLGTDGQGVGDR
jgi:hypothetical protein